MKSPKLEIRNPRETRNPKPEIRGRGARSVLECGGPPPLFQPATQSARGLAQSKTWRALLTVCLLNAVLCIRALAQFAIPWHTIDGGGGTSTGGVYRVTGTIGQPDAGGPMTNGQYSVTGGFWAIAIQQLGYPELNITQSGTNALVSWVTSESGLLLQFTTNLATPTVWTDTGLIPVVTGGVTNTVTVPLNPAQRQFFRLRRP